MAQAGTLLVKLGLDSKKYTQGMKTATTRMGKLAKGAKGLTSGLISLKRIAIAAFVGWGVARVVKDLVNLAKVQEDAEKAMIAALVSTGRLSEEYLDMSTSLAGTSGLVQHFYDLGSAIQQETKFGDEAILQSAALLAQLTDLKTKGLDAATKGAVGLATVYKQDLQAATTLVGKALAGNFGALSRYGIMVDRTATAEEKRASILSQLAVMYERAKAETDTFSGAQIQLGNVYGDLKEKIGDVIVKNKAIIGIMHRLRDRLIEIGEKVEAWVKANRDAIDQKINQYYDGISSSLGTLWSALVKASKAYEAFNKFVYGPATLLEALQKRLKALKERYKELNLQLQLSGKYAKGASSLLLDQIDTIEFHIAAVEGSIVALKKGKKATDDVTDSVDKTSKTINNNIESVTEWGSAVAKGIQGAIIWNRSAMEGKAVWNEAAQAVSEASKQTAEFNEVLIKGAAVWSDYAKRFELPVAAKFELTVVESIESWTSAVKGSGEVWVQKTKNGVNYFERKMIYTSSIMGANLIAAAIEFLNVMRQFVNLPIDLFDAATSLFDAIATWPTRLAESAEKFVESLINMAPTFMQNLADAIPRLIETFIGRLPEIVDSFIDAFIKGVPRIIKAFVKAIAKMVIPGAGEHKLFPIDIIPDIVPIIGGWFHKGGIIGQTPAPMKPIPTVAFANAPRAHHGLAPDERAIIAKKDEGIFTPEQMEALGGPKETVIRNYITIELEGRELKKWIYENTRSGGLQIHRRALESR